MTIDTGAVASSPPRPPARPDGPRHAAARRAVLPPPRRRRAPRRVGRRDAAPGRLAVGWRPTTSDGVDGRPRARRRACPDRRARAAAGAGAGRRRPRARRRRGRARGPAALAPAGSSVRVGRCRRSARVRRSLDAARPRRPPAGCASTDGTWLASTGFPSLAYVAGAPPRRRGGQAVAVAPVAAGRRHRARRPRGGAWRIAGSPGVPELLLAVALGVVVGAAVLVVVRCAEPPALPGRGGRARCAAPGSTVRPDARTCRGRPLAALHRRRAAAGRRVRRRCTPATAATPTCCTAATARSLLRDRATSGRRPRSSTTSSIRHSCCCWPASRRALPRGRSVTRLPDGSMALALEHVAGTPLDELSPPKRSTPGCSTPSGGEVEVLHARPARPPGAAGGEHRS